MNIQQEQQLQDAANQTTALLAEYKDLENKYESIVDLLDTQILSQADFVENVNQLEAIGPRINAIFEQISAFDTVASDLLSEAVQAYESALQPLQDKISDAWSAVYEIDWQQNVASYRESLSDPDNFSDGPAETLSVQPRHVRSVARLRMPFFTVMR